MNNGTGTNRILVGAVALLALAVGIQTVALFRLRERIDRGPARSVAQSTPIQKPVAPQPAKPEDEPDDVFRPLPAANATAQAQDPFAELEQMRRQMDKLFEQSMSRMPRISVYDSASGLAMSGITVRDEGDHYVATLELPGMDQGSVQIDVNDNLLSVSGSTGGRIEKRAGGRISQEFRSGRFSQSIALPGPADATKIRSRFDDGTLTITLPKKSATPPSPATGGLKTSV